MAPTPACGVLEGPFVTAVPSSHERHTGLNGGYEADLTHLQEASCISVWHRFMNHLRIQYSMTNRIDPTHSTGIREIKSRGSP
eukprot:1161401-Pelagomonas_calceolata.AAC.11